MLVAEKPKTPMGRGWRRRCVETGDECRKQAVLLLRSIPATLLLDTYKADRSIQHYHQQQQALKEIEALDGMLRQAFELLTEAKIRYEEGGSTAGDAPHTRASSFALEPIMSAVREKHLEIAACHAELANIALKSPRTSPRGAGRSVDQSALSSCHGDKSRSFAGGVGGGGKAQFQSPLRASNGSFSNSSFSSGLKLPQIADAEPAAPERLTVSVAVRATATLKPVMAHVANAQGIVRADYLDRAAIHGMIPRAR
jgi:hypothetical protein